MFQTDLFQHAFIPARRLSADGERRLMVVLHGRGDSIRPFRTFADELDVPELSYLLINGRARLGRGSYAWCGLREPGPGLRRTRKMLDSLFAQLIADGWKPENVFLFGFSEGCLAGADFALSYGRSLAGVIGVSGCVHLEPQWRGRIRRETKRTPWLFTHGLRDSVIRIERTREDAYRLRRAGIPLDWVEFSKRHEIEARFELPLIQSWVQARMAGPRPSSGRFN